MKSANYYIQDTINKFQQLINQPPQRITIYRNNNPFTINVPVKANVVLTDIIFVKCVKANKEAKCNEYLDTDICIYCGPIITKVYRSNYNTHPGLYRQELFFNNIKRKFGTIANCKYFLVLIPYICELYFQIDSRYEFSNF